MIPDKKLIALYTGMLKCRMITERARSLPRQLARPVPIRPSEEVLIAGIAADLLASDTIISPAQPLIRALLPRAPISQSLASMLRPGNRASRARTLSSSRKGSAADHAGTGNDCLVAACNAAADHLKRADQRIVVAICDVEDTGSNDWKAALRRASRENLPLVFVRCVRTAARNSDRASTNGRRPSARLFGVPIIVVDAGDVLAVYRVAGEAIARARHRRGPTLLDCLPNSAFDFRGKAAHDAYRATSDDSIDTLESRLRDRGLNVARLRKGLARKLSHDMNKALASLRP